MRNIKSLFERRWKSFFCSRSVSPPIQLNRIRCVLSLKILNRDKKQRSWNKNPEYMESKRKPGSWLFSYSNLSGCWRVWCAVQRHFPFFSTFSCLLRRSQRKPRSAFAVNRRLKISRWNFKDSFMKSLKVNRR